MKTTKFTEQQIVFALKQAEPGTRLDKVCRKMGISEAIGPISKFQNDPDKTILFLKYANTKTIAPFTKKVARYLIDLIHFVKQFVWTCTAQRYQKRRNRKPRKKS